ncbi:hypothetical protein EGW08_015989 [Elysia chlorotica]|uniref:Uncharacterized protein n=1 Tax=Elysia chlorotica TaxID=188477 RepID=A0A3S1BW03_ELYCH|nr:hypothetical protein EGW08_015989 [Elysia chlorotica]
MPGVCKTVHGTMQPSEDRSGADMKRLAMALRLRHPPKPSRPCGGGGAASHRERPRCSQTTAQCPGALQFDRGAENCTGQHLQQLWKMISRDWVRLSVEFRDAGQRKTRPGLLVEEVAWLLILGFVLFLLEQTRYGPGLDVTGLVFDGPKAQRATGFPGTGFQTVGNRSRWRCLMGLHSIKVSLGTGGAHGLKVAEWGTYRGARSQVLAYRGALGIHRDGQKKKEEE